LLLAPRAELLFSQDARRFPILYILSNFLLLRFQIGEAGLLQIFVILECQPPKIALAYHHDIAPPSLWLWCLYGRSSRVILVAHPVKIATSKPRVVGALPAANVGLLRARRRRLRLRPNSHFSSALIVFMVSGLFQGRVGGGIDVDVDVIERETLAVRGSRLDAFPGTIKRFMT
jgi:hypothetical protein